MIIECIRCFKKFDVDPSLIPDSGRQIMCGSCNHTWFFKKNDYSSDKKIDVFIDTEINKESTSTNKINIENVENKKKLSSKRKTEKKLKFPIKTYEKSSFTLSNILSIFIVIIISFIGLIILLDTFKSSLIDLFPGLELFLFNLFETLKDIYLFVKNLIL